MSLIQTTVKLFAFKKKGDYELNSKLITKKVNLNK
jgi:hypothetical protein